MTFVILAVLLVAVRPTIALEIQNFRAGLVCTLALDVPESDVKIPVSWICFETETIYLTGQGTCTYNNRESQCTWYGFEFNYTNADVGDEILCISNSDLPQNLGNPDEVEEERVTESTWRFSVPPGNGHFYNPQYSVLNIYNDNAFSNTTETVCEFDGNEIFRYRFTVRYPEISEQLVLPSLERLFKDNE